MPNIDGTNGADFISVSSNLGSLNGGSPIFPVVRIFGNGGNDFISVSNSSTGGSISGGTGFDRIEIVNSTIAGDINAGEDVIITDGSTIQGEVDIDSGTLLVEDSSIEDIIDARVASGAVDITVRNGSALSIEGDFHSFDMTVNFIDSTLGSGPGDGSADIETGDGDDTVFVSGSTIYSDIQLNNGNDTLSIVDSSLGAGDSADGQGGTDTLLLPVGTVVNDDNFGILVVASGTPAYSLSSGTALLPTGQSIDYTRFEQGGIVCFCAGTVFDTQRGKVRVERLSVGDAVQTADGSYQEIVWIGSRRVSGAELRRNPKLIPIRIQAGALGPGVPERDLRVSRQHRLLVRNAVVQRMFGTTEVLVPACKLLPIPGVDEEPDVDGVEYFHVLLNSHQIVWSDGALSESLLLGPESLKTLSVEALEEIATIFPEIVMPGFVPSSTWAIPPKGQKMKSLAERLVKNGKSVQDFQDRALRGRVSELVEM